MYEGNEKPDYKRRIDFEHIRIRKQHRQSLFNKRRYEELENQWKSQEHKNDAIEDINKPRCQLSQRASFLYGPKESVTKEWIQQKQLLTIILDEQLHDLIYKVMHEDCCSLQTAIQYIKEQNDAEKLHRGIYSLRKMISKKNQDSTDIIYKIIDFNGLTQILKFASQNLFPQLQLQALWIISNITFYSHQFCEKLVQRNCISLLFEIIKEKNDYLVDQAIWALGNIAADCIQYRLKIIEDNGSQCILQLALDTRRKNLFKNCIWVLISIWSEIKYDDFRYQIRNVLDFFCNSFQFYIQGEECFELALAFIFTHFKNCSQFIAKTGIILSLINICKTAQNKSAIYLLALKIIAKFSQDNDVICQALFDYGVLDILYSTLFSNDFTIREIGTYTLSNLAAGRKDQVNLLLREEEIILRCKGLLQCDTNEIRINACYLFYHLGYVCPVEKSFQIYVKLNIMELIIAVLMQTEVDNQLIKIGLMLTEKLLDVGDNIKLQTNSRNIFLDEIINSIDFLEYLDILFDHQDNDIYKLTKNLFENYLSEFYNCEPSPL